MATPTPIYQFKDYGQALDCLSMWRDYLNLNNWTIKLAINQKPDDMPPDCWGYTQLDMINMCAVIQIADPTCISSRILRFCAEKTLVHEMLHLLYSWAESTNHSYEGVYLDTLEHQKLNCMSGALMRARYNLPKDWLTTLNE